jgi:transposase
MLTQPRKLWLCTEPTDMRKSYDSLAALVRPHLGADPLSGNGFIFINRRRNQMKMLYFDIDGYCVWSKRLEKGRFSCAHNLNAKSNMISRTQFAALLEGVEFEVKKNKKRWHKHWKHKPNMAQYP